MIHEARVGTWKVVAQWWLSSTAWTLYIMARSDWLLISNWLALPGWSTSCAMALSTTDSTWCPEARETANGKGGEKRGVIRETS